MRSRVGYLEERVSGLEAVTPASQKTMPVGLAEPRLQRPPATFESKSPFFVLCTHNAFQIHIYHIYMCVDLHNTPRYPLGQNNVELSYGSISTMTKRKGSVMHGGSLSAMAAWWRKVAVPELWAFAKEEHKDNQAKQEQGQHHVGKDILWLFVV